MMRTLTKLVTKAKNAGHSLMRPSESDTPVPEGSRRFNASNVIANANTPSLNASIRTVSEAFIIVEKTLTALSPIQIKHEVSWPPASGVFQKFYRLEGTSEFLLVDLAVMTLSAPDKFLGPQIHGDAVFLFNKKGSVRA